MSLPYAPSTPILPDVAPPMPHARDQSVAAVPPQEVQVSVATGETAEDMDAAPAQTMIPDEKDGWLPFSWRKWDLDIVRFPSERVVRISCCALLRKIADITRVQMYALSAETLARERNAHIQNNPQDVQDRTDDGYRTRTTKSANIAETAICYLCMIKLSSNLKSLRRHCDTGRHRAAMRGKYRQKFDAVLMLPCDICGSKYVS